MRAIGLRPGWWRRAWIAGGCLARRALGPDLGALGVALAVRVHGVARGAGAEDEADQHAGERNERDEEDVTERHPLPPGASSPRARVSSRSRRAISAVRPCWRRHR